MNILRNVRAVSRIIIIILMIISAIIGGLITYIFTIASYVEIPKGTTITITDVFMDRENATAFKVGVLNPSFSLGDATITRIAVSIKGETQLYDIVETEPSIENGIAVPKGTILNITCSKVRKDDFNFTWGRFVGEFAGKTLIVHVFSSDSPAANKEVDSPFVKLNITDTDFDSKVSFRRFNITIRNDENSEINLTINGITIPGVSVEAISPGLPYTITKDPAVFRFNGSWHGIEKTVITISTEEGYSFSKEVELSKAYTIIQNVIFDEDYTDQFNVTVFNLAESTNYVNVTKITCTIQNGTAIERNYPSEGIIINSTRVFKFDWIWTEYRGKNVNVTAYLLQDFETDTFTKLTPPPIILKVLNEKEVFDLKDKKHFNITLQNHQSSLEAINLTKITVKETGEVINGTKTNPQLPYSSINPAQSMPFYCNITTINWTNQAGKNLTLIIEAKSKTVGNFTSEFVFALPAAKLDIINVMRTEMGATKYLNITVKNSEYSLWNLTLSKVKITFQNQIVPLEQTFPKDQILIHPNSEAILLCVYDWEKQPPENITISVITSEGIEASWQGTIP